MANDLLHKEEEELTDYQALTAADKPANNIHSSRSSMINSYEQKNFPIRKHTDQHLLMWHKDE